jgi:hypothetical protein
MKTVNHAIDAVYSRLKGQGGISVPVYKYTKPTKIDPAEYVVLNSLPIGSGVLQKVFINVNYYVKDLDPGVPDLTKLNAGTAAVMTLLQEYYSSGIKTDFDGQQIEWDYELSRYYSNIRFSIKLIN